MYNEKREGKTSNKKSMMVRLGVVEKIYNLSLIDLNIKLGV